MTTAALLQSTLYEILRDLPNVYLSDDEVATLADRLTERGVGMVGPSALAALDLVLRMEEAGWGEETTHDWVTTIRDSIDRDGLAAATAITEKYEADVEDAGADR